MPVISWTLAWGFVGEICRSPVNGLICGSCAYAKAESSKREKARDFDFKRDLLGRFARHFTTEGALVFEARRVHQPSRFKLLPGRDYLSQTYETLRCTWLGARDTRRNRTEHGAVEN